MIFRIVILFLIIILAEYYSFQAFQTFCKNYSSANRTLIIGTYLSISLFIWMGILFFRTKIAETIPQFSKNLFIAFTLGIFLAKILMMLIMLFDEGRRFFLWLISQYSPKKINANTNTIAPNTISRSKFLSTVAMAFGGAIFVGILYGMSNRYNYMIKRITLKFPNLPQSFKGLKIVQISDIHSGSFDDITAVERGINKIIAEKADLIFFTGDLVNNKSTEFEPFKAIFSKLNAPLGIYSTLGNHDYGDYVSWPNPEAKAANLEHLKKLHATIGWKLMMNEHIILEKGTDKIAVLGVENWSAKPQFPKHGDLLKAYNGLSEKNIPFKILLSHDPSHWDAQVTPTFKDIDLTLSGHTHGMQFGIEIPGFKWSPVKYMYKKWAGLYQKDNQYLYVNRGFGFLGYPGRLGIMPEITVFELS